MKLDFDGDTMVVKLEKIDRDWMRRIRNMCRVLGSYQPEAGAAADALTKVLPLIKDDGEFATIEVKDGDTNVVTPGDKPTETNAGDAEFAAPRKTGGGR